MSITFKPLGNRLIVKELPLTKEERMIGGLEVPESSIPFRRGRVIAVGVGEHAPQNGQLVEMECKVDDIVVFLAEAAHVPIRMNNEEYKLFRENQVEAIISE